MLCSWRSASVQRSIVTALNTSIIRIAGHFIAFTYLATEIREDRREIKQLLNSQSWHDPVFKDYIVVLLSACM